MARYRDSCQNLSGVLSSSFTHFDMFSILIGVVHIVYVIFNSAYYIRWNNVLIFAGFDFISSHDSIFCIGETCETYKVIKQYPDCRIYWDFNSVECMRNICIGFGIVLIEMALLCCICCFGFNCFCKHSCFCYNEIPGMLPLPIHNRLLRSYFLLHPQSFYIFSEEINRTFT